jgi:glutathione-independent formaldehyde dehydrogenase
LVFGHEITGQVVEIGTDCVFTKPGDLVSVPFNIGCGRCPECIQGNVMVCRGTNKEAAQCGIYGYIMGGGWSGGQCEYVLVPFADFNLLRFPEQFRDLVCQKWLDLSMLADAFSTGFHGCVEAGVKVGSTVLIMGCGPVGLGSIVGCNLLGASLVVACDVIPERLTLAANLGAKTIDIRKVANTTELGQKIFELTGYRELDCSVEAVGFECCGMGRRAGDNVPEQALECCLHCTKPAGKIGVLGVFFEGDLKAPKTTQKLGVYDVTLGHSWIKAHTFTTGQAPVNHYNECLMKAILHKDCSPAKAMNVRVVPLEDAPRAYQEFEKGAAVKFVLDPHGYIKNGVLELPEGTGPSTPTTAQAQRDWSTTIPTSMQATATGNARSTSSYAEPLPHTEKQESKGND